MKSLSGSIAIITESITLVCYLKTKVRLIVDLSNLEHMKRLLDPLCSVDEYHYITISVLYSVGCFSVVFVFLVDYGPGGLTACL